MKYLRRFAAMLILILTVNLSIPQTLPVIDTTVTAEAATVKLNKKKATLTEGKTLTLKLKGTKKTATWKSSSKKIASVSQKGKVTAKKSGIATITAKVSKKTLSCVIIVKPKQQNSGKVMVWIADAGKKYHSSKNCSNMKHPYQITLEEAKRIGREPCKKCYR